MATEHFCLRWNNHQSTLISVFDNLLESGTLVDCTLAADGRYLKAHKVVLSACSPYLGMLLSQHYDKHPIIILKDVKFEELKAMLDYMYRGEVNISQEQLSTFLKAAETLQIKGLTDTGGEEGNGGHPNRPPSSNSTTSLPNDDPQSPIPPGEGRSSPSPKKRKRHNKHSDESPDSESQARNVLSDGSDRSVRDNVSVSGMPSSVNPLSALKNVSFGSVKREPSDADGDGPMSIDESGDSAMLSRPGPSNGSGSNSKGSPWVLSADSTGEEMQLTPGQGPYMQNMMSMYGDMWMNSLNPMDMDQEMLAAYRFGRPNWNMNRYICTTCGRTYSLQASLYNHKKFECGKTPNFICPYCPHRTKQKGNLKTHIKKRHPEYFTEPFMPSPSRLNSMMNSIMMQSSMMQHSMMQSPQNTPTTQSSSSSVQNSSMAQISRSANQNTSSSSPAMQNSLKSQSSSINNLLHAMKQQGLPQNSSNQNPISTASLVQALSQSLPNSTSISALDIMQVLAQGTPKSPMTPHRMSPMNASPANCNPPQSPMSANKMSPMNPSSANSNPPQSPLSANVATSLNGGMKCEAPKSPVEMPSVALEVPKSPATPNFTTSLSLDPTESEDSSDTQILPSYPVTQ